MTLQQQLVERLGITQWDLLLVADGSGTHWDLPVGWAVALVDLIKGHHRLLTGGMNAGSINSVELFPYLYALRYHYYKLWESKLPRVMEVHIVSDSQVTVMCGQGKYEKKTNGDLWSLVDFWKMKGYNLHWHHVAAHVADEPPIHAFMDEVAGLSRKAMELAPTSDALKSRLD